ncbi:U3 snoRNP protein [Metarhizium album ARSEF 1941]|uniref:U3 snoRNP protein n=1 Tax=Metarhizium album (strain ARSEF 1941) TaxID=1081103 RepID=A0A0B2WUJ4_METAS|nr:U3 snoRNP protein [Metarhizium album ARSEF 1941]KHN97167.1 U3 snoRNP protein [Metarhizium album ARSEF 1941]
MAGVAEKARHDTDETRTIVQKRNEHEHRVLSPGNTPSEWSAYAKWEQSLETLRSKRCRRLKIHHLNSAHASQGRVLSIYERAVNRHPGSSDLWKEYLSYTASVKAAKRWRKTMTKALRVMPTDAELWIIAGRRSARNGDMAAARGFFMRGCRFCTQDCKLWLEYARSEMEWLVKVDQRKTEKKNGADALRPDRGDDGDELRIAYSEDEDDGHGDDDEGGYMLPVPSRAQSKVIDKQASEQLKSNPAMDGAIPMAIYDISRKQAFFTPEVAESFFSLFASFRALSVQPKISRHVLDSLDEAYPNHPSTCNCYIRQPILGVQANTADFPRGLREVLARLGERLDVTTDKVELSRKTAAWIDGYLALGELDDGVRQVLEYTREKLELS